MFADITYAKDVCHGCGKTRLCARPLLLTGTIANICEPCADEIICGFMTAAAAPKPKRKRKS